VVAAKITAQAEEAYDMKFRLVAAAIVCVVLASGAWAQGIAGLTTRAAGMGGAGIGVADDGAAWFQNPAGLAALNVACPEGAEYASDAMFSYFNTDGDNAYDLTWSGWKPSGNYGAGAGYFDPAGDGHAFGVGFGAGFKNMPLSLGFNVLDVDAGIPPVSPGMHIDDTRTLINAGLMYLFGSAKNPFRIGVTANDCTNELSSSVIWNAGASWMPVNHFLIAVDVLNLTEEMDQDAQFSGGAEYGFSAGDGRTIFLRAGVLDDSNDSNLTLGVGYRHAEWHADFAWMDGEEDSTWSAGLGVNL